MRILRFENEAEDLLHYLKDAGVEPGQEGEVAEAGDEHIVVGFEAGVGAAHALGGRDGLGDRRPVAAAAHRAARAARAAPGTATGASRRVATPPLGLAAAGEGVRRY